MELDLSPLIHKFKMKPLLVGGKAKEFYNIRKSGEDIDFIVSSEDYDELAEKYPNDLKDLWGDLGVCTNRFELWKTIMLFDYDFLSQEAVEMETFKIISLEKLLFLTALGMDNPKYTEDLRLIVKKIKENQYKDFGDSKYNTHEVQNRKK